MPEILRKDVNCDLCGKNDCDRVVEKCGLFYVRCRNCSFIYANPRAEGVGPAYDEYFRVTKKKYLLSSYSKKKQRVYRKTLRTFANYRKTNKILEIGSNFGGFLYQAKKMGWEPLGVEPAAECSNYAKEEHGLDSLTCILEDAGLEENSFDVIYSNAVFEHLPSPSSVLQEAAHILRPGGIIYTKTVNYESYTREILGNDWRLLAPNSHLSLFSSETLPRFCTQAGLNVFKVKSRGVRTPQKGNAFWNSLKKSLYSSLSRLTLKGDRIIVIAGKPI
jgi:SAM-dependent methyltransferase